jgi:hypothetical protein
MMAHRLSSKQKGWKYLKVKLADYNQLQPDSLSYLRALEAPTQWFDN